MKDLNVVIVGYGGMGEYHAWRLEKLNGFKVLGVYDIDPKRVEYAKTKGLKAYNSPEEVVGDKNVDAIVLAVPNDLHRPLTEFYASHKKHILCEKPATITVEDYTAMERCASSHGVILMVNQNRRCDIDFLTAKEIVDTNLIGDVYRVESRVMGANGIPGGWRKLPQHGGGMMLDWGVHMLDQICLMFNSRITSVDCKYSFILGFDVDDGFTLRLEFEDGTSAILEVDVNCYINLPRWILYGTLGTAHIYGFEAKGKVVVNYDETQKPSAVAKGNGLTKTMADRPHTSVREIDLPQLSPDYDKVYNSFHSACLENKPQYVTHDEVKRVLGIMELSSESNKEKSVIKIEI